MTKSSLTIAIMWLAVLVPGAIADIIRMIRYNRQEAS